MPNWCENKLVLKHTDRRMLERVVAAYKNDNLLAEFVPMPKALEDTTPPDDEPNWYFWRINNWGTNWDVSQDNDISDSHISKIKDNSVTLQFVTAWSPPLRWLATMSNLGFVFKLAYEEPNMSFYGIFTNASGVRNRNYCVEGSVLWNTKTHERNSRKRKAFEKRFDKISIAKAAPHFALPASRAALDSTVIKELVKHIRTRLLKATRKRALVQP